MDDRQQLVLIAHGSRDPLWRAPFEEFADELKLELGGDKVRLVYMDLAAPTLADVAAEADQNGISRLTLLPLFMSGGGHVDHDIPAQVNTVRGQYPNLNIDILPAIGEHPRVVSVMQEVAKEALQGSGL